MRRFTRRTTAALVACLGIAVPARAAFADVASPSSPASPSSASSPSSSASPTSSTDPSSSAGPSSSTDPSTDSGHGAPDGDPARSGDRSDAGPGSLSSDRSDAGPGSPSSDRSDAGPGSPSSDRSPSSHASPSSRSASVRVDNAAVSVNTTDGTSVFHLDFTIVRSASVSNLALAVTTCADCRSTAIAVQIDLVSPIPAVLTASNAAVAVTSGCTSCNAIAAAFQYVVASDQRLTLSHAGREAVRSIEHQLAALQATTLSPVDVTAQVESLAGQLGQVLATDLVPVHDHDDAGRHNHDGSDRDA